MCRVKLRHLQGRPSLRCFSYRLFLFTFPRAKRCCSQPCSRLSCHQLHNSACQYSYYYIVDSCYSRQNMSMAVRILELRHHKPHFKCKSIQIAMYWVQHWQNVSAPCARRRYFIEYVYDCQLMNNENLVELATVYRTHNGQLGKKFVNVSQMLSITALQILHNLQKRRKKLLNRWNRHFTGNEPKQKALRFL